MSTPDTGQAPETTTTPPTGGGQEPPTPATVPPPAGAEAAPWERDGGPFDPARAWSLITKLRGELAAKKTETPAAPAPVSDPALAAQVAALSSDLARERVARKHGLPDDLVGLLGDGDETALTERATALLAWRDGASPARPALKPRGGADPNATPPPETDPAKLAADVIARRAF